MNARTAGNTRDLPRAAREAGLLLVVAFVAAAASWALRADRLALPGDTGVYELELAAPLVQPEEARALYDEGTVLFADVREDAAGGPAIPGAFPLRPAHLDDDLLAVFDFVDVDTPLLLYGDGTLLDASNVAARLTERGYADVRILAGGLGGWRRAGGDLGTAPTAGKDAP